MSYRIYLMKDMVVIEQITVQYDDPLSKILGLCLYGGKDITINGCKCESIYEKFNIDGISKIFKSNIEEGMYIVIGW